MRIYEAGHRYGLENHDEPNKEQLVQFIHKVPNDNGTDGMITVADGTTNEEMLLVLIDRMQHLQKKLPCRENALVLTKLEEALMWLEKRQTDRQVREVVGTMIP